MIVLSIVFHGLYFVNNLGVLKPVLCIHMTSFNYSAKGERGVDLACWCHKSNIMLESIFIVHTGQCKTRGEIYLFVFCFCLVVILGTPFLLRGMAYRFITIKIVDLGKS